ncbi:MAG: DUF4118 domain-containing protein [Candidatus Metalachnospira sp.]|nr:DUF4118 domain-containing protein [Candidatus Metalachnospira sp.]
MKDNVTEHILTCLSPSPSNGKVILAARKMAHIYNGDLIALYVETASRKQMDMATKAQLEHNIDFAKENGAHIATTYGEDIAFQISQYAKAAGITKIVVGRPNYKKRWQFYKSDIIQQLIQLVPDLEVFMIPDDAQPYLPKTHSKEKQEFSLKSLTIMLGLLTAATIVGLFLKKWGFTDANIITVYILSVLIISFLTDGKAIGIMSSLISVLVFNFLFTEPRFTFMAYETGYPLTFLIMFISSVLTSSLTAKAREQAKINAQKAYRTEVLLTASHNLQAAESFDEILGEAAKQLYKLLDRPISMAPVVLGKLQRPQLTSNYELSEHNTVVEESAMSWVLKNNLQAGAGMEHFSDAAFWYLPVSGHDSIYAIVGIAADQEKPIGTFEKSLLMALLGECGVALEKHLLREAKSALTLEAEHEKMRSNFLRAISHDLRTPLTSISGNADMLMNERTALSEIQKHELYTDIYDDSIWLINLVENLLSITRMDDGTLHLNIKPELVSDVIDEAITHIGRRGQNHTIIVQDISEILIASMDAPLIVQVLVNLMDNAIKYTPEGSEIAISAKSEGEKVYITVADNGTGISDEAKDKIFNMFYTAGNLRSDSRRGLGLGLALCKAIIAAHGGTISVSDNMPRGTAFTFTLTGERAVLDD